LPKLGFLSSNQGKYELIIKLVSDNPAIEIVPIHIPSNHVLLEGLSSVKNAQKKALAGSQVTTLPVLASDDKIMFHGLRAKYQPGARIRRIIGENPTDNQVIEYYSQLITTVCRGSCLARITTNYSIAYQSQLVGNTSIHRECVLQVPPSEHRKRGLPLSALHYIPELGKRYSELSELEQRLIDQSSAQHLICFIVGSIELISNVGLTN
jgi:inosine/xanthosine triphosphate pyrophosphatase family protein